MKKSLYKELSKLTHNELLVKSSNEKLEILKSFLSHVEDNEVLISIINDTQCILKDIEK